MYLLACYHNNNYIFLFHAGKSLLWIAALGLAILFIYAIVSFVFLRDSVHNINNEGSSMFCENLGQCFVTVLRVGLIESLGSVST